MSYCKFSAFTDNVSTSKDICFAVYSEKQASYNYFYNYGNNDGNNSSNSDPEKSGEGSGIIMSEKNGKTYILTCAHVISEGTKFTVTLNNKKEYDASMVAYDSQTDIGVLSINATGLQVAEFANSDNLAVGEQVIAIGCPGLIAASTCIHLLS